MTVDPGPGKSAFVLFDTGKGIVDKGILDNSDLEKMILCTQAPIACGVIELPKSYGNIIGDSILQTCVAIGRIQFALNLKMIRVVNIPRKTIVTEICQNPRANDRNVRQSIIDLFGGKDIALGKKNQPGALYGVKDDIWSALAIAIFYKNKKGKVYEN